MGERQGAREGGTVLWVPPCRSVWGLGAGGGVFSGTPLSSNGFVTDRSKGGAEVRPRLKNHKDFCEKDVKEKRREKSEDEKTIKEAHSTMTPTQRLEQLGLVRERARRFDY